MRRSRPGGAPSGLADHYDYLIAARQRAFDRVRLLFHEVHHRAQVMAMLRLLGEPIQGLDYSLMRWEWFKEHR